MNAAQLLDRLPATARTVVRRAWMKYALRDVGGADNYDRLDLIYKMPDPWDIESARERTRFAATNRVIARQFPDAGTVLEVGSGEGHQSEALLEVCRDLHGVDVSATAVERARSRVPRASFAVGDIHAVPATSPGKPFDLIVACEVLYYIKDIPATLARMSALGRGCLVSIYEPAAKVVAPHLEAISGIETGWAHAGGVTWLFAWWRNP